MPRAVLRRGWLRRGAVLALGVWLLFLTRSSTLPLVGGFLDVSSPPGPVDYAMVLGGDAETRPFAAAALVRGGLARQVLLTQVKLLPESEDGLIPSEQEIARRALVASGVSTKDIVVLPGECNTTFDEARSLADFLDSHGECSVAVVTNPFHTRRARWVFRRVLGERATRVSFVAAPAEDFDGTNWWHTDLGTRAYVSEYLKLLYYLCRY